jgi:SHS2 domain-containing protein
VAYRLVESSSDIVVESEAADLGGALVYLAQGFSHVVTAGSRVEPKHARTVRVSADGDLPDLAVAFVNELIFLFDTEGFLPSDGALDVRRVDGTLEAAGTLQGEAFHPDRHRRGTEVKAATLHEAQLVKDSQSARARILLDL